jgi:hypothetical protein
MTFDYTYAQEQYLIRRQNKNDIQTKDEPFNESQMKIIIPELLPIELNTKPQLE